MKKIKEWFPIILMWTFIIALIGFGVYTLVKYGGKPITEIPTWALWLIFGK